MVKKKANAPLGFFFSSFLLHTWRLGTDQSEDADVWPVSKILCGLGWREGLINARWSNHKIQILLEVFILLIRLKVVEVKTLASLVSGSLWRSSLQIFFFRFFLSIEYCSAHFRFGSFLLRRFFGLSQYRLSLYFGSSSTSLSVFISCSSTWAHAFAYSYFDCGQLHFRFAWLKDP